MLLFHLAKYFCLALPFHMFSTVNKTEAAKSMTGFLGLHQTSVRPNRDIPSKWEWVERLNLTLSQNVNIFIKVIYSESVSP